MLVEELPDPGTEDSVTKFGKAERAAYSIGGRNLQWRPTTMCGLSLPAGGLNR